MRPLNRFNVGAISLNPIGDVGLGLMVASLAPDNEPHLGAERLAQGYRRGLAIGTAAAHYLSMSSFDLTEDERAELTRAFLRNMIAFRSLDDVRTVE